MEFENARNEVKARISCRDYLTKAPKGNYICPFCGSGTGRNQSGALSVDADKNRFTCFSCGKTGDVIDLYAQQRGYDPGTDHRRAVCELAGSIGITVDGGENPKREITHGNAPKTAGTVTGDNSTPENVKAVKNDSEAPEGVNIPGNTPGKYKESCQKWAADVSKTDYFRDQGLNDDIIKRFRLGYDTARDFVIYPYNEQYSYYLARKAVKNDKQYRKPPASEAGPEPLYNPAALYTGKPCFITEGPIDALSIIQAGGCACAICGAGEKGLIDAIRERPAAAPLILWLDYDPLSDTGHRPGQETQKRLGAQLEAINAPYIDAVYNLDVYGVDHGDPNDLLQVNPVQFAADVKANIDRAGQLASLGADMFNLLADSFSEKYKPIPTGISGVDDLLNGGLLRQTLVLLGAEPAAGKTIFSCMVFENMAKQGIPVIYFNLEMSKNQLLARSLARIIYTDFNWKVNALDVLQGYKQESITRDYVLKAARKYAAEIAPNMIYNPLETAALDELLKYINNAAENALKAGKPAPCVCIDYLHLLTGNGAEDASEIIKRAVAGLKEYAENYNTIVFGIFAQNRIANESGKPRLASGRDSSALEYSGDLILQLVSENEYDQDEITLHVVKSRFTQCNMKDGLTLIRHGGQSYFEQKGDWVQADVSQTPFAGTDPGTDTPKKRKL